MNPSSPARLLLKELAAALLFAALLVPGMVLSGRLGLDLMLFTFERLGIAENTVNLTSVAIFLVFAVGMVFLGVYPAWYLWLLICSRLFSRSVMERITFKGGIKISRKDLDRWFPPSADDDPPERPQQQYAWQQASWRPYSSQRPAVGAGLNSLETHLGSRLIAVGVCIVAGLGLVWLATGTWRLRDEVARWPTTAGVVVSTRIQRIDGGRPLADPRVLLRQVVLWHPSS